MIKTLAAWVIKGILLPRYMETIVSHEIRIPINQPGFNGMSRTGLFHAAPKGHFFLPRIVKYPKDMKMAYMQQEADLDNTKTAFEDALRHG